MINMNTTMDNETMVDEIYDDSQMVSAEMTLELILKSFQQARMDGCQSLVTPCEERPLYQFLVGHAFLFVFCLAMIGNCLNLLIYKSEHIRFYIAIRMLCTRLLMNTLTMLCLLPQALRIISVWEPGSDFDHFYWKYYSYQIYLINVFGFCAMWITVLMTTECYLHVFFPSYSKSWCTIRNLSRVYLIVFVFAAVLSLIYPLNRTASVSVHCDKLMVSIDASDDILMVFFERLHTVANLIFAIVLPTVLLVFMTTGIVWKLILKNPDFPNTNHFTSEKRCVTRITLITTCLQLIAELPPIPVFIYAIVVGPTATNDSITCIWKSIGAFLGLCNMSISFFIYFCFSEKFREMVINRFFEIFGCCLPDYVRNTRITSYRKTRSREMKLATTLLNQEPVEEPQIQESERSEPSDVRRLFLSASCRTDSCLLRDDSVPQLDIIL